MARRIALIFNTWSTFYQDDDSGTTGSDKSDSKARALHRRGRIVISSLMPVFETHEQLVNSLNLPEHTHTHILSQNTDSFLVATLFVRGFINFILNFKTVSTYYLYVQKFT